MNCGVVHRRGSDPAWLWLWLAAVAPIPPLAWETPHATSVALKKKAKRKKKKGSKTKHGRYSLPLIGDGQ